MTFIRRPTLFPLGEKSSRNWGYVYTASVTTAATNRGQGKALGRLLWLSVDTVVMLDESMRQSGRENAGFVDLLQRLRDGVCNAEDYDLLAGRHLRKMNVQNRGAWKFAPVIVTSNATRDAINRRAAEAFAE